MKSPSSSGFNTQPPEGGWAPLIKLLPIPKRFNTQPPEGGWKSEAYGCGRVYRFNTQPPEGGWPFRPDDRAGNRSFNTQPPEGGWWQMKPSARPIIRFQHTAARRRLANIKSNEWTGAGFNTQPPEGGWSLGLGCTKSISSFNTQPPEGGWKSGNPVAISSVGFQHTAARRRLGQTCRSPFPYFGFNTQPPEGGWGCTSTSVNKAVRVSTHSRPKAAGRWQLYGTDPEIVSTHSRPKAAGFVLAYQVKFN